MNEGNEKKDDSFIHLNLFAKRKTIKGYIRMMSFQDKHKHIRLFIIEVK